MASETTLRTYFVLAPDRNSSADTEYVKADPVTRGSAPKCSMCGLFIGMRPWLAPRHARIVAHGESLGDFAFASSSDMLVSDRVKHLVGHANLRGMTNFEQVGLGQVDRTSEVVKYYHADIAVDGLEAAWERSGVECTEETDCPLCHCNGISAISGFEVEASPGTSLHIGVPWGLPGIVVVSDTFKAAAEATRLTNLMLLPTAEYTWGWLS